MDEELLPRILIIDDLFGRSHFDRINEDRANLCGQYLVRDITGDEANKGGTQRIKRPVAEAVFCRGQSPAAAKVGDIVENDLEHTLEVIRRGWFVEEGKQCWTMVLLDLCFYTGLVTPESDVKAPGMPAGRPNDNIPSEYFGLRILHAIQLDMPELPVVILSSKPRDEVSREFSRKGALAFIPREQGTPDILRNYLRRHGLTPDSRGIVVGRSKLLLAALRDARQLADSEAQVLIRGEAGTGKELLAKYIHYHSPRSEKRMEAFSLAAITTSLAEDTLFGHVKGAFDGAASDRPGVFELASGGTLFLDEVGDTPPEVQPKLLRVIQDGEVQRLGTDRTIKVDVRIVSATNVDIEGMVASGKGFRRDLLDRLRTGGTILLPPLRRRPEDLRPLAEKFIREAEAYSGALHRTIDPATFEMLREYDWPGNIREFRNVIVQAVTKYPDVEHLVPFHIRFPTPPASTAHPVSVPQPEAMLHRSARSAATIEELVELMEDFQFVSVEHLVGKLPKIEGAYARLIARYLKAALRANTQNRTPENPHGEVRIQPTVGMMRGGRVPTSKAADIIKQLLSINEAAVRTMIDDPNDLILKRALERALSLRPKRQKKDRDDVG
jgi:DNA-binding NtrC family response regulator